MKTYECNGWFKFAEQDSYEHGCDPDTAFSFANDDVFKGQTIEEVLKQIKNFLGVDDNYEVDLDACGEEGRVDISVMESEQGYPATEQDIEKWKRGELALWSSTYSFEIQEVERTPVNLREHVGLEERNDN
jgi:hypothetical protein